MTLLLSLSEGERIALIGLVAAVGAGIPGAFTLWLTNRVKKENTTQHGESQRQLGQLTEAVTVQTVKLDEVRDDVREIAVKVDGHSDLIARHDEHLSRLPNYRATGSDGPHPVL